MTPDVTRYMGPDFGSEQSLHQQVCVASIEERDELFRILASIHVEGE